MYVPFNFVVIKSLEKKGLRFTVRFIFTLALNSRIYDDTRELDKNRWLDR